MSPDTAMVVSILMVVGVAVLLTWLVVMIREDLARERAEQEEFNKALRELLVALDARSHDRIRRLEVLKELRERREGQNE